MDPEMILITVLVALLILIVVFMCGVLVGVRLARPGTWR